jgi:hypothetical protein
LDGPRFKRDSKVLAHVWEGPALECSSDGQSASTKLIT